MYIYTCIYIYIYTYIHTYIHIYTMSQCVAACCSVLLCVEVCCSVLQCVALFYRVIGVRSVSQMLQPLIPFVVGTVPQGLIYMWYRSQTQQETQIPQYKFKLGKKNINLNLYHNIPRNRVSRLVDFGDVAFSAETIIHIKLSRNLVPQGL